MELDIQVRKIEGVRFVRVGFSDYSISMSADEFIAAAEPILEELKTAPGVEALP
jgi:hypothetical protein